MVAFFTGCEAFFDVDPLFFDIIQAGFKIVTWSISPHSAEFVGSTDEYVELSLRAWRLVRDQSWLVMASYEIATQNV